MPQNNRSAVNERRQKLWTLLTKGMKGYEIAKELNTHESTISRDIKYLSSQSQNYLNDLAKETLPFMYQTSIEGIRDVIKECHTIYQSQDQTINMYQNYHHSN
jgi:IS30 family transposase